MIKTASSLLPSLPSMVYPPKSCQSNTSKIYEFIYRDNVTLLLKTLQQSLSHKEESWSLYNGLHDLHEHQYHIVFPQYSLHSSYSYWLASPFAHIVSCHSLLSYRSGPLVPLLRVFTQLGLPPRSLPWPLPIIEILLLTLPTPISSLFIFLLSTYHNLLRGMFYYFILFILLSSSLECKFLGDKLFNFFCLLYPQTSI